MNLKSFIIGIIICFLFTQKLFSQDSLYKSPYERTVEKLRLKGLSSKEIQNEIIRIDSLHYSINSQYEEKIHEEFHEKIKLNQNFSSCNDISSSEKAVLQEIYNQLNGLSWAINWNFSTPVTSWNSLNGTGWKGITLDSSGCHVIKLEIPNLSGYNLTFPDITNLSELKTLEIGMSYSLGLGYYQNYVITSGFLSSIGNLSNLEILGLRNVNFHGSLPNNFINLATKLKVLKLVNCNLSDNSQFCTIISNFHELSYLKLTNNYYSGVFPNCLSSLTNLTGIDLAGNQITNIDYLNNIQSLYLIDFAVNLIDGNLPLFNNLTNLGSLNLSLNFLEGTIPSSYSNLYVLLLSYNNLRGLILPNLASSSLAIDNNKFRFSDFITVFDSYTNLTVYFGFSPQQKTDSPIILNANIGQNIILKMFQDDVYSSEDTFQWFKGVFPDLSNPLTSETIGNNSFSLNVSGSSFGEYFCISKHYNPAITNSNTTAFNNLTLVRHQITLSQKVTCYNCTSFDLLKDEKYLVSAWVKEEYENDSNRQFKNYENSAVSIGFTGVDGNFLTTPVQFFPSGEIIDGWQRIVGEFVVPTDVDDIHIELLNLNQDGKVTYFDDVRVLPSKGNMKSFVYDQKTQRLMAELDENNYSTFYEYDLEGGLIRVKKETERGVFTIQETRSGNTKK